MPKRGKTQKIKKVGGDRDIYFTDLVETTATKDVTKYKKTCANLQTDEDIDSFISTYNNDRATSKTHEKLLERKDCKTVESSDKPAAESEATDKRIWFNYDETTAYSSEDWAKRYQLWSGNPPHSFLCNKQPGLDKATIIKRFNNGLKTRESVEKFLERHCHVTKGGRKTKKTNKRRSRKTRRAE